jgi:cbb3-type cytochrome oxidase cytochrome c subunit
MPATEETYRSQPTLHIVFAISSIAMALSVVWMIMADHLRPWKDVQRKFHEIEHAKLEVAKEEQKNEMVAKSKDALDEVNRKIEEAEQARYQNRDQIRQTEKAIQTLDGRFAKLDTDKRFMKARLDSQRSLYDGMIDLSNYNEAAVYLKSTITQTEERLKTLSLEFEEADKSLRAEKKKLEALLGNIDELQDQKKKLERDYDRSKRVLEQKDAQYFGITAWLRGLPGFDLMPPTKIQQISLPELTINYNFKEVPRYDRCTTCHQGIDRLGFDLTADGYKMPTVFASHPHLTDGATTVNPQGKVVPAGLYLDANGPHKINSFGCTICHGGQGSGTDFTYASHTPNDIRQKEEWQEKEHWREIHHWDEPMLPKRFMESSCLKCHHEVTDVPQATKLQAGYQRIVKYGCTGCHQIGGEGSFGPDLTDERQVGPNLAHVGSKSSKEWVLKWIKNPHAFRPDSRMPRFYGVTNNSNPRDIPKSDAEILAITHYLFSKSTPPPGFTEPPAKSDPKRGKDLFLQKGCMACHSHRPYEAKNVQLADQTQINSAYKHDPGATFDPSRFPENVRTYADADFGPNLVDIAAKFPNRDQGYKWLANWIKAPENYHVKSLMPNLQLSSQDAADIAAWLLSVPGGWRVDVDTPTLEDPRTKAGLDELVKLFISKGSISIQGKATVVPLSEIDEFVEKKLSRDDKLMFLGEKTIGRMGCFGCHVIPGFESAKPIGTALNGWGIKSPAKLDYGHIAEYLDDQSLKDDNSRDGTDHYYQEKLAEHTRSGFLYQKIHRPRSYDYKKTSEDLKAWDDRLRMPQFAFANDPAAVEEVMTFVLGLTGEKIAARYLPKTVYKPEQFALARGSKFLNRYNCSGCHVLEMPKYTIPPGMALNDGFTNLDANIRASYASRATDYLSTFYHGLMHDPKKDVSGDKLSTALGLKPDDKKGVTLEGMPIGSFEDELTVQLWKPVTIRGYAFNVGDTVTLNKTKVATTPARGGDFAWLYAGYESDRINAEFSPLWNRLPPPLIREGVKVQTPWLTSFLKDPYPIRPATNLRMPKFHYGVADDSSQDETAGLANYFAARDGAVFPYQSVPEKTQGYLADTEVKHPDYLKSGWTMMAAKTSPCISCHAIGASKPTGGDKVVNGPDFGQVAGRFRPEYLKEWIAKPSRLVPYTAMPQNIAPSGPAQIPVPKTFEDKQLDQVTAIRDTLLNYVNAVELQLAGPKPVGDKVSMPAPASSKPSPKGSAE